VKWCLQVERNLKVMHNVMRRASQVSLNRAWNAWNQYLLHRQHEIDRVMRYVMKQVLNGKTSAAFRSWVAKVQLVKQMEKMLLRIVKAKESAGFRGWLETVRRSKSERRHIQLVVHTIKRIIHAEVSKAWLSWVEFSHHCALSKKRQKVLLTKFGKRLVNRQLFLGWSCWQQHTEAERQKREKILAVFRKCLQLMQGKTRRGFVRWRIITERCNFFQQFQGHLHDPKYLGAFFDSRPELLQSLLSLERMAAILKSEPNLLHHVLQESDDLKCPNCEDGKISDYLMQHGFKLPQAWASLIKVAPKATHLKSKSTHASSKHMHCENPLLLRAVLAEILYSKIVSDQEADMRGEVRLSMLHFVPAHLLQKSRLVVTLNEMDTSLSKEETAGNVLKALSRTLQQNVTQHERDQDNWLTTFTRLCTLTVPHLDMDVLNWVLRILKGIMPLLVGDVFNKKTFALGQMQGEKMDQVIASICSDLKCSKRLADTTTKVARELLTENSRLGHDTVCIDEFVAILVSLYDEHVKYNKGRRKVVVLSQPAGDKRDLCSSLFMSFQVRKH
jgi:hypothetical protein